MRLKKPSELFEQRRLQSLAEEAAKKLLANAVMEMYEINVNPITLNP